MSFRRGLTTRSLRRAIHPVRSTAGTLKRRSTPKPVRAALYARHPIGTASTSAGRKVRRSFFR